MSDVHRAPGFAHAPGVSVLLADDGSYAFEVAINPSANRRRIGAFHVRLAPRIGAVRSLDLPARSARVVPLGVSRPLPPQLPPALAGTPPPFADPEGTVITNGHLRVVFAPFAGARIAEFGEAGANAATSIGLFRDAVEPEPAPSSRDYIASYTHPLPAGTFNRSYACTQTDAIGVARFTCAYDAADLPRGGGTFSRTLTLGNGSDSLTVDETFTPHDVHSGARLESVSGFAFRRGDALLRSRDRLSLGILHSGELTCLRWQRGDVGRIQLRTTRRAELVTLVFARRTVQLTLGLQTARSRGEAQHLLDANHA